MSDSEDRGDPRIERDRKELEVLLSAAIDGELEPGDAERIEALRVLYPDQVARTARFEDVDRALRSLAETPIADERLAASLDRLETRLAQSAPMRFGSGPGTRWVPGLFVAAAAALAFYLFVPRPQSGPTLEESVLSLPGATELVEEPRRAPEVANDDEALILALGLLDGEIEAGIAEDFEGNFGGKGEIDGGVDVQRQEEIFGAISDISEEDFEVIEQLELLEFLAAREMEGRG